MKKILLTDNYPSLKEYLSKDKGFSAFIILKEGRESLYMRDYLAGVLGMKAISKKDIAQRFGHSFKSEFSKALYHLNKENDSIYWWAMTFTNKMPLMSKLYENAFYFSSIKEMTSDQGLSGMVVVSDSRPLSMQLRAWAEKNSVEFVSRISPKLNLKHILRTYTPFTILYVFLKLLYRKAVSHILSSGSPDHTSEKSMIMTQFENRALDKEGIYRDAYFGDIKDRLSQLCLADAARFITVGLSPYEHFNSFMAILRKRRENRYIYTMEYFLPIKDVFASLAVSLARYRLPATFKGRFDVAGEDASGLVRHEIKESISSGQFFLNLSVYASISFVARKYNIRVLYYPFENRSWEKMAIMAFRNDSPRTRLAGYQHTIITPKHLNYFMEPDEFNEIPAPDKVITDGEITNGIMRRWNFPQDALRTGCALRVNMPGNSASGAEELNIRNILVALGSGLDEYVKMLIFLDAAFNGGSIYDIVIRHHPVLSIDAALKIFRPSHFRYHVSNLTLAQDLANCDLVLYASSTVSLEALSMGKAIINIELDDYLSPDPMFDADVLKWRCSDPRELLEMIGSIAALSKDDLQKIRTSAIGYARRYFYPVNRENLKEFLA